MPKTTRKIQPKKKCPICGKEKSIATGFYKTVSPLYPDGTVPICISCVKKDVVNEDGTINLNKFKTMMQRLDKPLYWSALESAYNQYRKEHGFLSDDEIAKNGKEIVSLYFKNINSLRQNKTKSYADSEKDNFISQNSNITKAEYDRINRKYNKVNGASTESYSIENVEQEQEMIVKNVVWSVQDLQNKSYAIDIIGYDPFEEYPEDGRRFLFNQLSPYLEDDSNIDDAYKLSQILQIIKNNFQIDTCDKKMAGLDPLKEAESIKTLSDIKNKLVASNDKIAKENEISVKNRSNKEAGKSTLTYLMRDLREKDFDKAEADYYDQLKSPGTRWAVDMSITSIKQNGIFDENDKKDIYEMQLEMIDSLNKEVDDLKEKVRILLIENDKLKAGIVNE